MSATAVTSSDRLSFALFLALLIHAVLILGISFTASDRDNLSKTLEVTLATYKSDKAPEQADFLAQENQEGSGTLDEARMLTTDVEATFHANEINETSPQEQQASAPRQVQGDRQLVTTSGSSRNRAPSRQERFSVQTDKPDGPEKTLLERSLEMASLEAKLDSERQAYAKKPRIQRLTAASTMKTSEAYYVDNLRRKIEQMGALNYPRELENCFDNCRLRFLVAINANGTINELRILESSGKKVLDDAALRIVRLSAPFAPFTEEMRKQTDILEIIRTLRFKGNRYVSDAN
ncbi:TonB family protein [Thalassolituus sp. C2-1]|uniref:TonB family protein n=1 Tax=Venatorbacter sp. C2-1 TaxID=2597518 RepID=UPI00118F453E|nr:TonB family protein [Thalassolituus sp. C2-1]MBU2038963.1 TonB family protein [Gammaproteobacteria bacterium]TVV44425.1 TonB family protein [Thalassolituus sp. C2-1]